MSREIKFRAWDNELDCMNQNIQRETVLGEWLEERERFTVMQFTGLKDKNGKEIYDGDIVSAFHGTQLSAVTWNEDYGLYEVVLQVSGLSEPMEELLGNHLDVIEVIGNIHEDGDLLSDSKITETN
jgi:uncharacterized phage protein (TIGR01671 family)